jgi:MoxR-like ATPase
LGTEEKEEAFKDRFMFEIWDKRADSEVLNDMVRKQRDVGAVKALDRGHFKTWKIQSRDRVVIQSRI